MIENGANKPSRLVFSRFHWESGTLWVKAVIVNGGANVTFLTDRHVPMIHSSAYIIDILQIVQTPRARRKAFWYSNFFRAILFGNPLILGNPSNYFTGTKKEFSNLMVKASILPPYEFSYDTLVCILLVGDKLSNLSQGTKEKIESLRSLKSAFSANAKKR